MHAQEDWHAPWIAPSVMHGNLRHEPLFVVQEPLPDSAVPHSLFTGEMFDAGSGSRSILASLFDA